jgi:hypothetical protein
VPGTSSKVGIGAATESHVSTDLGILVIPHSEKFLRNLS